MTITTPAPASTLLNRIAALKLEVAELPQMRVALTHLTGRIACAEAGRVTLALMALQFDDGLDDESKAALLTFQADGTLRDNLTDLTGEKPMADLSNLTQARRLADGLYELEFDHRKHERRETPGARRTSAFLTRVTVWRDDVDGADAAAPAGETPAPGERGEGASDLLTTSEEHAFGEIATSEPEPSAPPVVDEVPAAPREEAPTSEPESSTSEPAPSAEEPATAPAKEQHDAPALDTTQQGDDLQAGDETAEEADDEPDLPPSPRERILAVLAQHPWLTSNQITERAGLTASEKPNLSKLAASGRVVRIGDGGQGDLFRYALPGAPRPAPTPAPEPAPKPEPTEPREGPVRDSLLAWFRRHPGEETDAYRLADAMGLSASSVRGFLPGLVREGVVVVVSTGAPGNPAVYRAAPPADEPADESADDEEAFGPTARERVVAFFEENSERVVTPHDLTRELGMPRSSVQDQLRRLVVSGTIELVTSGTPKAAATYRARPTSAEGVAPVPLTSEDAGAPVTDTSAPAGGEGEREVPSAALETRAAAVLTAPDVSIPAPETNTSPQRVEPANTTPTPAAPPASAPAPKRVNEATLSDPEKELLGCLRRAPNGMSAGLLASRLGWRTSSAQSILGDLIAAGFAERGAGSLYKAVAR